VTGSWSLAGKVAVVTGAGSGLGAAMAHEFAAAGMAVAVLDIDEANAGKVAAALAEEFDVPATAWRVDVGDPASVEAAARHVQATLGGCDVVCANVGVQQFGAADKLTEQDWEWLLNVNVKGTVRTVREFLPLLRARSGFRRIVFTASSSALAPGVRLAGYQTTKFAVMGFAETLALELRDEGIGVTILFPGGMMTRHLESSALARPTELGPTETAQDDLEAMLAFQPMGEGDVVTAEEAVRNLVTDMLDDQLYSLTHGNYRDQYELRRDAIERAFDRLSERREPGIPRSSERGPSGPARSAESGKMENA
jgi:NAD(P)-dependent dehydrogenase (short-subunit alcohol dehydrogenase family)